MNRGDSEFPVGPELHPFIKGQFWAEDVLRTGAHPKKLLQACRKRQQHSRKNPFWEGVHFAVVAAVVAWEDGEQPRY